MRRAACAIVGAVGTAGYGSAVSSTVRNCAAGVAICDGTGQPILERGYTAATASVPESASWAMHLLGFAATGVVMRHRRGGSLREVTS